MKQYSQAEHDVAMEKLLKDIGAAPDGRLRGYLGRKPIKPHSRYSARLTYRAARAWGMGRRTAYLCAVARCGWPSPGQTAYRLCQSHRRAAAFLARP